MGCGLSSGRRVGMGDDIVEPSSEPGRDLGSPGLAVQIPFAPAALLDAHLT
jgi:hypothetical protein